MRKIEKIIIHCSDSDNSRHDDISVIRQWHVNERGFSDVGYHYFIKSDGAVQKGRNLNVPGAHCSGHNAASIGICVSGRVDFKQEQFDSLVDFVKNLRKKFGEIPIYGHRDLNRTKSCPNFDVKSLDFSV